MMRHLFIGIAVILFAACQSGNENRRVESSDKLAALPVPMTAQEPEAKPERKLIRDGHVEFETDDIDSTRSRVIQSVKKHQGYISNDQEYKLPGRVSVNMTIRVPAENFDPLIEDATKGVKRFDSKGVNVNDVTEEFIDVEARLKTKKELEERYLELLQKASAVKDILEIETQMGALRSDIESIEGRLKYLENQVAFSTLNLNFYETIPGETEFGARFQDGFRNGWDNLVWFFVFLTNIWPFIVIAFATVVGFKVLKKRKRI